MRCFVGIELDSATRAALADACDLVRAASPGWAGEKWVRPENLHVTVAFLGDIEDSAVADLAAAIGNGFAETRAFALPFRGLRAVPGERRASMLWAAYDDPEGCAAGLAGAVAAASEPFGIAREARVFKAHVTLVRARRPHRIDGATLVLLASLSQRLPEFVSVPSATLFSSTLTKAGPIYRPLASWAFGPAETSS